MTSVTPIKGEVELAYTPMTSNYSVTPSWTSFLSATFLSQGTKVMITFACPLVTSGVAFRFDIGGTTYRFGDSASSSSLAFSKSLVITPAAGSRTVAVQALHAGGGTITAGSGAYATGSAYLRVVGIGGG